MNDQYWSWILTAVGLTGFILAGKKVWWCWYINIACQVLWFTYAIVTEQYGFIVAALAYTFVFSKNAIAWTKEHRMLQKIVEPIPEVVPKKIARISSYEDVDSYPRTEGRIAVPASLVWGGFLDTDVLIQYIMERAQAVGEQVDIRCEYDGSNSCYRVSWSKTPKGSKK